MPLPAPLRIAVVLSGCGTHDGSEPQETVLALLALDRAGARAVCAAPNAPQAHVVDHYTGELAPYESRNVLVESARLARGAVTDLAKLSARDVDGAVFPGGYGAVKNLSDYALRARDARVHPEAERLLRELHAARKPVALLCTAALLAARVLGKARPLLTVGNDQTLVADLEAWGARHQGCDARSIVVDREHKLVSTPAYTVAARLAEVAEGIDRAVRATLELA